MIEVVVLPKVAITINHIEYHDKTPCAPRTMLGMNTTAGSCGIPSVDNIVALSLLLLSQDVRTFADSCHRETDLSARVTFKGNQTDRPTDRLTDSAAPLFTDGLHCAALDHN